MFPVISLLMAASDALVGLQSTTVAAGSLAMGLAVVWLGHSLGSSMTADMAALKRGFYEDLRRRGLRAGSLTYRLFEPLIDELAANLFANSSQAAQLERRLEAYRSGPAWKAPELLAVWCVEGLLILGGVSVVGLVAGYPLPAVLLGGMGGYGYVMLRIMRQSELATHRLRALKRRLPYAIDLMALMMEAGAIFLDALETVVLDNRDNPLGVELGQVLQEIKLGRTRTEALLRLRDRFPDDDLSEIIFAIVKGEELGTPLSQILRTQADQMRLKRSQWAEKAAAEAQVRIVFPGMLIMIACLMIIVAPFLLKLLDLL